MTASLFTPLQRLAIYLAGTGLVLILLALAGSEPASAVSALL